MNIETRLSSYADAVAADCSVITRPRSHPDNPAFEQDFAIDPPGVHGLDGLIERLRALASSGMITDWRLGHWKDRAQTLHSVFFKNDQQLDAARLSIPSPH